jgi:hypothetical protein
VSRRLLAATTTLALGAVLVVVLAGCTRTIQPVTPEASAADAVLEDSVAAVRAAGSGRFVLAADANILDTVIVGKGEGAFSEAGYDLSLLMTGDRGEWHFRETSSTTYMRADSADGESGPWQDVGGIFLPVDPRGYLGLLSMAEGTTDMGPETIEGSACWRIDLAIPFSVYMEELYRAEVPEEALAQMDPDGASVEITVWIDEDDSLPCRISVAEDNGNTWIIDYSDWGAEILIEEPVIE